MVTMISNRVLLHRKKGDKIWEETIMKQLSNDKWEAVFKVSEIGWYEYTIKSWVDHFASWQKGFKLKYEANQDIAIELKIGALV
jgi:starch synthase (maltosyl-transferring)